MIIMHGNYAKMSRQKKLWIISTSYFTARPGSLDGRESGPDSAALSSQQPTLPRNGCPPLRHF
jgi:hypothetical protein